MLQRFEQYRKRIIINVRRPMRATVKQRPMVFCNPFTVQSEDLIPIQIHVFADNQGELCWLRHDERQEWLWLSNRTPEETILILSYDSDVGEGPRCQSPMCEKIRKNADSRSKVSLTIRLVCRTRPQRHQ